MAQEISPASEFPNAFVHLEHPYDRIANTYERVPFTERVERAIQTCTIPGELMVLAADLDGLHPLNQATRGYEVGDTALRAALIDTLEIGLPAIIEEAGLGPVEEQLGTFRWGTDEVAAAMRGQFANVHAMLPLLSSAVNATFHESFRRRVNGIRLAITDPTIISSKTSETRIIARVANDHETLQRLLIVSDPDYIYGKVGRLGLSVGVALWQPGQSADSLRIQAMQNMTEQKIARTRAYNREKYNPPSRALLWAAGRIIRLVTGEQVERL